MKRNLSILFALIVSLTAMAQHPQGQRPERPHMTPEEYQTKQKEYIAQQAELTDEESAAFFPLYFELQGKKFELERNARRAIRREGNENISEEQCLQFVNSMADVRIEIATLEKEYTTKYLEVIPACKLLRVQQAEQSFQRHLMREMTGNRARRNNNENR